MEFYNYCSGAAPTITYLGTVMGMFLMALLALVVLVNTDMPQLIFIPIGLCIPLGLACIKNSTKDYHYVSESQIIKIDLKSKIVVIDTSESSVRIFSETDEMAIIRNPKCKVYRYYTTNGYGWKYGTAALLDTGVINGSR